jgi:hypothetical protein
MGTSVDTSVVVGCTMRSAHQSQKIGSLFQQVYPHPRNGGKFETYYYQISKFSSFHGLLYGIVLTSSNVCWLTIYIYSRVHSKLSIESEPINVGINVFYAISKIDVKTQITKK